MGDSIDKSRFPLLYAVDEYIKKGRVRMHTPGHGGRQNDALAIFNDILKYDITELDGLESLYSDMGAIAASERYVADVLGVKKLLYSTGGSTLCIQSMLYLAAGEGGRVIFAGGLHKSAINACILLNITPVFIKSLDDFTCMKAEAILREYNNVKAIYITNPDYYGRIYNTAKLYELCCNYNIPLLVDGAHGAHLSCFDKSINPLHMGASMTAQSAHKTLPALTGGAWLCIHEDRYLHNAKYAMSMFGSTSPSYLIMLSLELAVNWLKDYGKESFSRIADECSSVKEKALQYGFDVYNGLSDPARITLNTSRLGISGKAAAELFRECKIEPEMYDGNNIVFIVSAFLKHNDFERFKSAVSFIGEKYAANIPLQSDFTDKNGLGKACGITDENTEICAGKAFLYGKYIDMQMSPRAASLLDFEEVGCEAACGRIAAEIICPCPPGTPITIPGGIIDERASAALKSCGIFTVKVVK